MVGVDPAWPPPPSTVNGPFFPLLDVLQGILSILFAVAVLPARLVDAVAACPATAGLGSSGRSLVVLDELADVVDLGDDLDEVTERGDGPLTGGEGEEEAEKGEMVDGGNMMGWRGQYKSAVCEEGDVVKGRTVIMMVQDTQEMCARRKGAQHHQRRAV